jgi:hypothetical protein
MITVGTVWFVLATYVLMLAAYFYSRFRWFHVPVMATMVIVDVMFPFYLYLTHDWYKRLIVHEEIFSFLIWMHFALVVTLYALYFLQIQTARKIFAGNSESRGEHRSQANAILLVRALVIATALMLVDPESVKAAVLYPG